jgi:hypothetical protein
MARARELASLAGLEPITISVSAVLAELVDARACVGVARGLYQARGESRAGSSPAGRTITIDIGSIRARRMCRA